MQWAPNPRFANSPGDSVLSPASRAPVFLGHRTPGSRTHRGLHSVARCAGSRMCRVVQFCPTETKSERNMPSARRALFPWVLLSRVAESNRALLTRATFLIQRLAKNAALRAGEGGLSFEVFCLLRPVPQIWNFGCVIKN